MLHRRPPAALEIRLLTVPHTDDFAVLRHQYEVCEECPEELEREDTDDKPEKPLAVFRNVIIKGVELIQRVARIPGQIREGKDAEEKESGVQSDQHKADNGEFQEYGLAYCDYHRVLQHAEHGTDC